MTPLEIIGLIAVGGLAGRMLALAINARTPMVSVEVASKQIEASVCEAFEAGMLCAADIATHSGNEKLAGDIRKTVQFTSAARAANDNNN